MNNNLYGIPLPPQLPMQAQYGPMQPQSGFIPQQQVRFAVPCAPPQLAQHVGFGQQQHHHQQTPQLQPVPQQYYPHAQQQTRAVQLLPRPQHQGTVSQRSGHPSLMAVQSGRNKQQRRLQAKKGIGKGPKNPKAGKNSQEDTVLLAELIKIGKEQNVLLQKLISAVISNKIGAQISAVMPIPPVGMVANPIIGDQVVGASQPPASAEDDQTAVTVAISEDDPNSSADVGEKQAE